MHGIGLLSIMGCKRTLSMGSTSFLSCSYSRVVSLGLDYAFSRTGEVK